MARIDGIPEVKLEVTIRLSEEEAGALDALAGYGTDAFLKAFYEVMGRAYLEPYETGLRSLFDSVRDGKAGVGSLISRTQEAREVFLGQKKAVDIRNQPTARDASPASATAPRTQDSRKSGQ